MLKISYLSLVLFCAVFVVRGKILQKGQCSTLACVHATATLIEQLDFDIKPCDDFYGFACGNFDVEIRSANKETIINTQASINSNVIEYLMNILLKPLSDSATKLHKLSKKFFNSCSKIGKRF